MKAVCSALLLLAAAVLGDSPEEVARRARKGAGDVAVATINGDYRKVVELTHGPIVEFMGGREKSVELIGKTMESMKKKGIALKSYEIGEPGDLARGEGAIFIVLPFRVETTIPGGRVVGKSFLLGVSTDNGASWKYADGSGLIKNKSLREKVIPNLPKSLALPEAEKPMVYKDF